MGLGPAAGRGEAPDISSVAPDLQTPSVTEGPPGAGKRVRQVLPEYQGTQVYHLLYLPTDWKPERRFPVIVEYAGNGPYSNRYNDISTGHPEGSNLGYGISGGQGFIWVCLPYVDTVEKRNQTRWWGDVDATLDYCRKTVRGVCDDFGGDPAAVILAGFSRGAIACGYLGLHDDRTADMWLAFIPYSHYDGVRKWNYAGSDRASALERLKRLKGRATFVCQEGSIEETRQYLLSSGIEAPFTFLAGPFRNHNDAWVLRDVPQRQELRSWLAEVLRTWPGTHVVRGRAVDQTGRPIAGVQILSGDTHRTTTGADGRYELPGLTDGRRAIAGSKEGFRFHDRDVVIAGQDLENVDLTPAPNAR